MDFEYDDNGVRRNKTINGTRTHFLVDPNRDYAQVLEEYADGGITLATYVYGDDLVSQERSSERSYFQYDGLGSTRALTDSAGLVTDRYTYTAFGEMDVQSGSTENDYLYTGEQFDAELDQYYLRARYYDPSVGRFTQMDTFQGRLNAPVTLHKYLYGNVDPVNHVDPSGNVSLLSLSIRGAITRALSVGRAILRNVMRGIARPFLGRGLSKVDPNKLKHIFGQQKHNLDGVVKQFGSQEKAFNAMQKATETAVRFEGHTGVFETAVRVGTEIITVRGAVVGGVVKIGTAFK